MKLVVVVDRLVSCLREMRVGEAGDEIVRRCNRRPVDTLGAARDVGIEPLVEEREVRVGRQGGEVQGLPVEVEAGLGGRV